MTAPTRRALLSARGVTQAFGDEVALAGMDLDLVPGEIHARAFFTMVYAAEGEPLPAELEAST